MDARRLLLALAGVGVLTAGCATAADVVPPQAAPPGVAAAPAVGHGNHVYVFLVNGLDPLYFCRFDKVSDYVRSLGYDNVYLGQTTAARRFTREIRRIRGEDPCARIALVGFSTGANNACRMANDLAADGTQVDLLVYLGGCWVSNGPEWRPENARRIVNIRDSGLITLTGGLLHPDTLDGAENVQLPGLAFHVVTPGSLVTQDTLARELAALAAELPPTSTNAAPTPRAVGKP